MVAHPLDVQCRLLAQGTRMQKRRAWRALTEHGGFWAGCREGASSGSFDSLTSAYALLSGSWDRSPLLELPGVTTGGLRDLLAGALRLLATAAFVAGSRAGGAGPALAPWLWRTVDPSHALVPLPWLHGATK